jgi:DNA modification methylase
LILTIAIMCRTLFGYQLIGMRGGGVVLPATLWFWSAEAGRTESGAAVGDGAKWEILSRWPQALRLFKKKLSTQFDPVTAMRPWPADQVECWPIERLTPYANNARLHSEADLDKIGASIIKWGWTMPVLADENGGLIAGHGRVAAAPRAGVTSIPVIVARGWTEEEKRAYRLADNQLAARAVWDPDLLRSELQELGFADFDLGLIGFGRDELEAILKGLGSTALTDPDSVPEVPRQPVTQPGDEWLLNEHRVGCGDSTNAANVARVLAGAEPHLMIADRPYGVDYQPSWRAQRKLSRGRLAQGKVLNDDRADWREAYALFPGDVAYVWHGVMHSNLVAANLAAWGFQPRAQIIWSRQHFTLSRGDYHWHHEVCWYAVRAGKTSHWEGGRSQTTVWEIANNNPFGNRRREESWGHGTPKPVECMRRPIVNNSRPGEAVCDPFLGSGTSVLGAEMTGRVCYGLELNPAYVDVIVRRWQLFTGRNALHHASGQSFDERATRQQHGHPGAAQKSICCERRRARACAAFGWGRCSSGRHRQDRRLFG